MSDTPVITCDRCGELAGNCDMWKEDGGKTYCCKLCWRGHSPFTLPALTPKQEAAEEMFEALTAFIEAWDKSHQLEKTDVARRLAVAALAKAGRA